jgi:hypothetical protein
MGSEFFEDDVRKSKKALGDENHSKTEKFL